MWSVLDVLQEKCSQVEDVWENVQQVFTLTIQLQLVKHVVQTALSAMMVTPALFVLLTLQ